MPGRGVAPESSAVTGPRDITVVGASIAGLRATQALRELGYDGRLRLIGAEPELAYQRPPLSKRFLTGEQTEQSLRFGLDPALDIDVQLATRATGLDLAARQLHIRPTGNKNDSRLRFDGLIIATGAQPIDLGLTGRPGVHLLRSLPDAMALRDALRRGAPRVLVVGGGLIGCEVAATCRTLGLEVSIVEREPLLMRRTLGDRVATALTDLHRAHGVRLHLGAALADLLGAPTAGAAKLSDGSIVEADVVVVAVGVRPAVSWLRDSGLPLRDGVLCAENLAVRGLERLTAAGDVTAWPDPLDGVTRRVEHWDNAVAQARAAARTLLTGPGAPAFHDPGIFWSDQYGVRLHVLGRPQRTDLVEWDGSIETGGCTARYMRHGRLAAVALINRPRELGRYRRLLDAAPDPTKDNAGSSLPDRQ